MLSLFVLIYFIICLFVFGWIKDNWERWRAFNDKPNYQEDICDKISLIILDCFLFIQSLFWPILLSILIFNYFYCKHKRKQRKRLNNNIKH
jgi:hypothetical protein